MALTKITTNVIADNSIVTNKIAANAVTTSKMEYVPINKFNSVDFTFGKTGGKVYQDLMYYYTGGTVLPTQIPFYAETKAQAEKLAIYVVTSFMNDVKGLENDMMFDQARNSVIVNAGLISSGYLPSTLSTATIDVDETEGAGATAVFNSADYFRVVVASNGVNKLWTCGVVKGSVTDRAVNSFNVQIVDGETGVPSGYTGTLNTGMGGSAWKVTEAASVTGSTGSIGIVIPYPVSVSLNF